LTIVGIAGRIGSGKTTVQDYLGLKYGFFSINFADKLKYIASELRIPPTRDNLQRLGHGMRQILWDTIWIDQVDNIVESSKTLPLGYSKWVIGDVRYANEAEWLVKKGTLLFLEVRPQVRYDRIQRRGLPKDKQTWEEFIEASKHPTEEVEHLKQHAKYVIDADISLQVLYLKIDRIMEELGVGQVTTTGSAL